MYLDIRVIKLPSVSWAHSLEGVLGVSPFNLHSCWPSAECINSPVTLGRTQLWGNKWSTESRLWETPVSTCLDLLALRGHGGLQLLCGRVSLGFRLWAAAWMLNLRLLSVVTHHQSPSLFSSWKLEEVISDVSVGGLKR